MLHFNVQVCRNDVFNEVTLVLDISDNSVEVLKRFAPHVSYKGLPS